MRALEFLTGHVIFKLRYNQIYQLKTTFIYLAELAVLVFDLHTTLLYCKPL